MDGLCLWTIKLLLVAVYIKYSDAHGRLLDPIARSSGWRKDSRFPPYYDDNQMFCGGRSVQWDKNGGKCSICGEDYSLANKLFDKGGSMYTGIVVKNYTQGQTIDIYVQITANHLGWFEFRICNVDGLATEASQECLDRTVLKNASGYSRFEINSTLMEFRVQLVLPSNLTCEHCVVQWKYNTGNSWGADPASNQSCQGCGPGQEQFYGCSDVSISGNNQQQTQSTILSTIATSTTTETASSTISNTEAPNPTATTTVSSTTSSLSSNPTICTKGDGNYADIEHGCMGFYTCVYTGTNNAQIVYRNCPVGTLFDNVLKICNFANQVICQ